VKPQENSSWTSDDNIYNEGRTSTEDIGNQAVDLLMGIRARETDRLEGLDRDMTQIKAEDTKESILYKMYE
jgi:hypothetical protein